MSRMIKFLSIAVVLFSLAASASWYLQHRQTHEAESPTAHDEKGAKALSVTPVKASGNDAPNTRPLIRAPISGETDRMAQVASTLQHQQEALKTREQQLTTRE